MSEILKELQQRTLAAKEREQQKLLESVQTQVDAAIDACRKAADEGKTHLQFGCPPFFSLIQGVVEGLKKESLATRVIPPSHHSKSDYTFIVISWDEADITTADAEEAPSC